MISEDSETATREINEETKEISVLKEQIKSKKLSDKNINKTKHKKNKIDKSLSLFKNDINIKKPKYFGRTRSLFFIGETPIFVLGESSKKYFSYIIHNILNN